MSSLPITEFVATNFYFTAFLFGASALLLAAIYLFRWKSDLLSTCVWLMAYGAAGIFAWWMTGRTEEVMAGIGINLLLVLVLFKLKPVISMFGVFFAIALFTPAIYGAVWTFELAGKIGGFWNTGWLVSTLLFSAAFLLSLLLLFSTIMGSYRFLVRFSELYFRFPRRDAAWKNACHARDSYPMVSIHVPCYAEPPEIVIQTLDALAKMDYPNFEVIVLDNNTKDANLWKPLEDHCKALGDHFRFFHIDGLKGAKAGALNRALQLTAKDAKVVAILDADFVSQPDFLKDLIGFFDDPRVGYVQSCHNYREWEKSRYLSACCYEYLTHFKLELPGISEWDAAYTVGTMCMVRKDALEKAGGWAEWCLTEDSELAVRLHALGYTGYNLKETFGRGLIPEVFEDYKKQRFRWSAGPMQQLQRHWRLYIPWNASSRLSFIQKVGELFHSLSLFFSDPLFLVMNVPILVICLWQAIGVQQHFLLPTSLLIWIPVTIGWNIACNFIHIKLLGGGWRDYLVSAIAVRSLSFTKYKAFYMALMKKNLSWQRTNKFKMTQSYRRVLFSSRTEIILGICCVFIVACLAPFASYRHPDVIFIILLGLLNLAVNYLCAPIMAVLSEQDLHHEQEAKTVPVQNTQLAAIRNELDKS